MNMKALLLIGLSLMLGASHAGIASKSRPPNVIIFMTDDQSPMDWEYNKFGLKAPAAWGYTGANVYSPNVDKLAAGGMVFERAYVSTSVCTPSRYSTLTGRYPSRTQGQRFMQLHPLGTQTRVENIVELDPPSHLNLPKLLQGNGYRTGFVGKSHIVDHDILNHPEKWGSYGLQEYSMDADPEDPAINAKMQHNQKWWQERIAPYGFDSVNNVYAGNLRELFNRKLNVHNIEWTTDAALEFIEDSKEEPFFLYYAPTLPHGPDPWVRDGKGKYRFSMDADPNMTGEGRVDADYPFMPTRSEILETVVSKGYPEETAYVTLMDAAVGALVAKLEALDLLDNTVLIITSDHGAWRYGKTTLYEGGLRVPLIVHWPAKVQSGSRYSHLVSNVDHTPTILGLTHTQAPLDYVMDGIDLCPVILGDETGALRESIFAEIGFSRGVLTADGWKYIAIRYPKSVQAKIDRGEMFESFKGGPMPGENFDGGYRGDMPQPYLVRNGHLGFNSSRHNPNYFQVDQLYNINDDPREHNNIAEENPEQVKRLQALLGDYLKSFPERPFGEFTK
jgi:arylsulfatase A-like enzyme